MIISAKGDRISESIIAKIIVIFICIFSSNICYGQNIWETFDSMSSLWTIPSELTVVSNSKRMVNIINQNYQSDFDKKNNRFSAPCLSINTTQFKTTPHDISFMVRNVIPQNHINRFMENNVWIWGILIYYETSNSQKEEFKIVYATSVDKHSGSLYEQYSIEKRVEQDTWKLINSVDCNSFRIIFDDGTIKIYNQNGNNLVKTIYEVNSIISVDIAVSSGSHLEITNTICKKKTVYGQALPYIIKATNCLENNDPVSAAREITIAINKNLKCYDTFLIRGIAYYAQKYYKSAIEDFTTALRFSTSNNETAYYYRGMSKLAIDDEYGINDLKNGGQEGLVFLRENNLLNYKPDKKPISKKSSYSHQHKKRALKK